MPSPEQACTPKCGRSQSFPVDSCRLSPRSHWFLFNGWEFSDFYIVLEIYLVRVVEHCPTPQCDLNSRKKHHLHPNICPTERAYPVKQFSKNTPLIFLSFQTNDIWVFLLRKGKTNSKLVYLPQDFFPGANNPTRMAQNKFLPRNDDFTLRKKQQQGVCVCSPGGCLTVN